jgi:hypothetical protein
LKIAIVGSKPDTWEKVRELDRDEWQIWRFSRQNWKKPPVADVWFELHKPKMMRIFEIPCPGYTEFCKDAITQDKFPVEEILNEFGPYFFTGGQAPWIMAYAITLKPETIGLWGIDPQGDYKPQRSEMQHFIQIARDRGIEVIAPEETILTPRPLYGWDLDRGPWTETADRGKRPEHLLRVS